MDDQPADSFSLINDPRNEYGKLYTVDKLGNLWGGRPVLCTSFISVRALVFLHTPPHDQMSTRRSTTSRLPW